jgi:hypothetical protein
VRLALASVLAAVAVLVPSVPAQASTAPMLGIADQKPEMFSDPLFKSLGIHKARLVIPWDVLHVGWQRADLDTWLNAAHMAGVRPLVSFGHSRRRGRERILPTVRQLRHEFLRLRRLYPFVDEWATWNEANHCSQATCHHPGLVAHYYNALRKACRSCKILAAEVLDMPNMVRWVKKFRHYADDEPRYWGLHNYLDANRLRTIGTRRLLAHTRGQIWFTETGGIVKRRTKRHIRGFRESSRHAAVATRWVFDRLAPLSPRITRVYLYHWNPATRRDKWDSGLLSYHGRPRPAYKVLRHFVRATRAARSARAAKAAARRARRAGTRR